MTKALESIGKTIRILRSGFPAPAIFSARSMDGVVIRTWRVRASSRILTLTHIMSAFLLSLVLYGSSRTSRVSRARLASFVPLYRTLVSSLLFVGHRHSPDLRQQCLIHLVLGDERRRAGFPRPRLRCGVVVEGKDHYRTLRGGRAQRGGGRDPVHARHLHVHQDHVGVQGSRQRDRLGAVARLTDHLQVGLEGEPYL